VALEALAVRVEIERGGKYGRYRALLALARNVLVLPRTGKASALAKSEPFVLS